MSEDTAPPVESESEGFIPPDFGETGKLRVGEEPELEPEEPEAEPVTELTDEERKQFRTVMAIGKRTKKFSLLDHPFVIQTIMCDDELRIGLTVRKFQDTTSFSRAYQCATVAAAIVSVDGENWNNSLAANPDYDELFARKFDKVVKMHPMVVQYVYDQVKTLEVEFAQLLAKLGKL